MFFSTETWRSCTVMPQHQRTETAKQTKQRDIIRRQVKRANMEERIEEVTNA